MKRHKNTRPARPFERHRRSYRSMYVEPGCSFTSHRYCLALKSEEEQFVVTAADPSLTLTSEKVLLNRNYVKAPECARPHHHFLDAMFF